MHLVVQLVSAVDEIKHSMSLVFNQFFRIAICCLLLVFLDRGDQLGTSACQSLLLPQVTSGGLFNVFVLSLLYFYWLCFISSGSVCTSLPRLMHAK